MFSGFNVTAPSVSVATEQLTPWVIFIFIVAVFCAGPVNLFIKKISEKVNSDECDKKVKRSLETVSYVFSFAVFAWCIIRLSGSSYNPFLYFKF